MKCSLVLQSGIFQRVILVGHGEILSLVRTVTKVGGIALCAAIAPYREAREKNRFLISQSGTYIEVYVAIITLS